MLWMDERKMNINVKVKQKSNKDICIHNFFFLVVMLPRSQLKHCSGWFQVSILIKPARSFGIILEVSEGRLKIVKQLENVSHITRIK